uniref:Phospholipid/glycerol acyltransferase domain-containing protein n=1 Tax=viral metagenome TaxID=1070528 RepID=A0A6C0CZF2_9ZZZZ
MFQRIINGITNYINYINYIKNDVGRTFRKGVVYGRVGQLAFHYIITFLFFPKVALKKIFQVLNLELQTIEGLENYERECVQHVCNDEKSSPPTIMIFNHPNAIDPLLLFYHFFPYPRFVTSTVHIPWILRLHAWKMRSIVMTPYENTKRSEWIYQQLEKREREGSNGLMTIAPTAGREYSDIPNANQHILPSFRKGAFLKKYPILPVIIQYDPFCSSINNSTMYFLKGESTMGFLWRLVSRYPYTPIRYSIRVLPKIVPQEGEEIESFMERVKLTMEIELYKKMHNNKID